MNRLVSSKLKGKFTNDTYEQFAMYNMNEIDRDIDGMKNEATLNGQFFPADKVTLDEQGKSFVYDFAEEKEIQKIELFKTNLEKNSRIRERDLHIYIKLDEADEWSELTPDCWNYEVDSKNQSIHFNFKETVTARFIKIRTIWDDRDIDNNNVSEYVTFKNDSIQKMIRIWTIEDSKNEFYEYDKNSNRITLETYASKNDYAYYKNSNNGNTARVMYDGKWWYTYDANGNRTARAMNAEHNGNVVNIDKSDEYWEYEWDYHNRLVKVQQFNAPDNAQNVKVEYTYDAMNRRIERISYTGETSELTQYAYGRNGALTYQEKTAGSSVTTRSFVYLNNQIIGFMDTENSTESIRYAVTDIQGSVTEVYDEDNRLLWKSGYTAFGIKAGETTDLIDFDGLYIGCDYDTETGLTYHWNRWRGEDGSNWLTQDPARDGANWYGYAGQNPTNCTDSNGLFVVTVFLAKTAIGATTGALIGFSTNIIVQVGSNIIKQAASGNDINIKNAITNVDLKSAGSAALSGAISGAITGGAGAVQSIATAVQTSKVASAVLNTAANMVGTTVGTVVDNSSHDKNLTDGLALNLAISATTGIISGATSKTGTNVIDRTNGSETIMYTESIDSAGVITIITTVAPTEIDKDIGVSIGQEISGAISNSMEGN